MAEDRPHLSDFVRGHRDRILGEWGRQVRAESVARGLPTGALADHLPDLLDRIADHLGATREADPRALTDLTALHALSRLDLGFDLPALVKEYRLLRSCVLRLYERTVGQPGVLEEIDRFDACLDAAVTGAVERYTAARARTLLALDRLSEAALGNDEIGPLLTRLLQVVVETVEAVDMGAILLWEGGALRVRASVGMPEGFSALALGMGEGFAGAVAVAGRPLALRDGGRDLAIPARGLPPETKALYGVPLREGERLVGVAYVGSRTALELAPEDTLLLRTMATRTTGFIVQARLLRRAEAERARADAGQQLLQEREVRYRALFEAIDEGFCLVEVRFDRAGKATDYRFVEVNRAFERQTGLRGATGRWVRELVPGHEEHWFETYGHIARTGEARRFESRAEALGRWYDVYAFRVGLPEQRQVGILFQDVTTRKRAEQELREADQRKTEFLATLSHELRNPLAPIRNGLHLLELLPRESPQAERAMQIARRQTDHLARLVDDLLDVTRISRGKIALHRQVADVGGIVDRTCEDLRSGLEQGGVELRVDLPAGPVWADVDPTRLAQAIGNLLQNAGKFTPAGGAVTVSLRARSGEVELEVSDTGIGMEAEDLARVFVPFVQASPGLARTRGGLGLGLPLARALLELHGGALTATSPGPGRGSRFTMRLPRTAAPDRPVASADEERGARERRVVVIIEDNVDAGQTLAELLELEGHESHLAHDGATGITLARALRPDLVVCDLGLPDVSGFEVARTLRQDGALASTRLVALSGYAQGEDRQRAREAGFDAHLAKPASLEHLISLLP